MSYPPGPPPPDEGESDPQNPYPTSPGQQPGYPPPPGYGQQPPDPPPPGYGQPGYPPPPGYGQQPGYGGTPSPSTNGKALASLITGITALVLTVCSCGLGGLIGVVAVFLGYRGRGDIKTSGGGQSGDGLALGGIITGIIATVIGLIAIAFFAWAISTGNTEFSTDPTDPYGNDYNF